MQLPSVFRPLRSSFSSSLLSAFAVVAAIALSGCATTWRVDSDVQSFSSLPATATNPPGTAAVSPATFRFERLPLQQPGQAQLEAMALPALTQVGLVQVTQDDAAARYKVQVSAQLQQVAPAYWNEPFPPGYWWPRTSIYDSRGGGGAWWPGYGGGFGHPGFGYGFYSGWDDRSYQREVSVVMRDATTGQVVYETRAANLGRWPVDRDVLPLMFSAALSGFPQPPAGLRRVNITVPR